MSNGHYSTVGRVVLANLVNQVRGFGDDPKKRPSTLLERVLGLHDYISMLGWIIIRQGQGEKEAWVDGFIAYLSLASAAGWDGAELYQMIEREIGKESGDGDGGKSEGQAKDKRSKGVGGGGTGDQRSGHGQHL